MKTANLIIPFVGFLAGFIPVAVWHYLNWAPFSWTVISGILVAVLFSLLWSTPNRSRHVRIFAAVVLALIFVVYLLVVTSILSASSCGFVDGRLYCLSTQF
jgi:hypothetical protein